MGAHRRENKKQTANNRKKIRMMYRVAVAGLIVILLEVIWLCRGGDGEWEKKILDKEGIENMILLHFDIDDEEEVAEPVIFPSEDTKIRVLLKTTGFRSLYHEEVKIESDCKYTLYRSGEVEGVDFEPQDILSISSDSNLWNEYNIIKIVPEDYGKKLTLLSLQRSYGPPVYRGTLEVHKTSQGLLVINELNLEEYLYGIVPSEMPASYPMEALKAQAISARTFAYRFILYPGYPAVNAHLDDSTTYQVYNNITEQQRTNRAVDETACRILYTGEGSLAESYYYSTSCGLGADGDVWGKSDYPVYLEGKFINNKYMKNYINKQKNGSLKQRNVSYNNEKKFSEYMKEGNPQDFEKGENWYRWEYTVENINTGLLYDKLQSAYESDPDSVLTLINEEYCHEEISDFGIVLDMEITERGRGGNARALLITTDQNTFCVRGDNTIRRVLLQENHEFVLQDNSVGIQSSLLPSAFFVLNTGKVCSNVVGYTLVGGGLGHGVGMSQNGAKHMAAAGYKAEEILGYFYNDCIIYEGG